MSMVDLQKAYISQATYVAGNELDKRIRYKQEAAEECFRSFFTAQSQQTNVPDDFDPTQPRLIFQAPHKQLLLSQVSSQLTLGFDSASKRIDQQLEIITKNFKDIHSRIENFKTKQELKECALVVVMSFPSTESRVDLSEYIYNKFLTIKPLADIASTSIKAGYQLKSGIFLNLEIDVYEKRRGEIQSHQMVFNISDLPVIEVGISVKIDINNRPQSQQAGYENPGPHKLLELMSDYMKKDIYTLMGFE